MDVAQGVVLVVMIIVHWLSLRKVSEIFNDYLEAVTDPNIFVTPQCKTYELRNLWNYFRDNRVDRTPLVIILPV